MSTPRPAIDITSQEVRVDIFRDGRLEDRLNLSSFVTFDIETSLTENYLGASTVEYDSIFKGCKIEMQGQVDGAGWSDFIEQIRAKSPPVVPEVHIEFPFPTVVRTRAGFWLLKGCGPTRRYRTKALAVRAGGRRPGPARWKVVSPFELVKNGLNFELRAEVEPV